MYNYDRTAKLRSFLQSLYHGTDQRITSFRTRTHFSADWEIAASFAVEAQQRNGGLHAYVYEILGDVTEVIRQSPIIEYAFDSTSNADLGPVYFNNKVVKPRRRFEVAFDPKRRRYVRL